jgi:hypothetical protein
LNVLGLPTPAAVLETDGELLYPPTALEALGAVSALPSFFRILGAAEPEPLDGLDVLAEPLSGLLTVCGLADVPAGRPWDLPAVSGFRIVRGLVGDVPIASRPIPLSWVSPVERSSLRRRTRFPSSGWTEIFVPAGLRLRFRLVRLILVRLLRESPLRAFREMPGSLRWFLLTTVRARDS